MSKYHSAAAVLSLLISALSAGAQESSQPTDPLAPLEVLAGTWEGESAGFGETSKVTHEWKKVLGGKFMRLQTRAISKDKDGNESVREDVGYASWSQDEGTFRFRHFLSEGFVNTFRLQQIDKPAQGFNFEPESTEGYKNLAARMTLRFDKAGGYEMILELGTKGKPLAACQTIKVKKFDK